MGLHYSIVLFFFLVFESTVGAVCEWNEIIEITVAFSNTEDSDPLLQTVLDK